MDLADVKARLHAIEPALETAPFAVLHTFERGTRRLNLAATSRLRKQCRKAGLWGSPEMLATLKNAAYGFDEQRARSAGGRDGIFLLDRNFRPPNEMMRKLFDRFLDRPASGAPELAAALGTPVADLLPVRLVSHHLRLRAFSPGSRMATGSFWWIVIAPSSLSTRRSAKRPHA